MEGELVLPPLKVPPVPCSVPLMTLAAVPGLAEALRTNRTSYALQTLLALRTLRTSGAGRAGARQQRGGSGHALREARQERELAVEQVAVGGDDITRDAGLHVGVNQRDSAGGGVVHCKQAARTDLAVADVDHSCGRGRVGR